MGDKAGQLAQFLNGGNAEKGLQVALSNPPYDAPAAAKQKDIDAVVQLLVSIKEANMASALQGLSVDELDVLSKYIYKGLESGNNSPALFKWFAALQTRAGGLGHVVRVLTDEKKL